jgi:hypothetical protein
MKITNPDRDSRNSSQPQVDYNDPKLITFKDQLPVNNSKIQSSDGREFPQHIAFL